MRRQWAIFVSLLLLCLPLAAAPRDMAKPTLTRRPADTGFFRALQVLFGDLMPQIGKARSSMDPDGGGDVTPSGTDPAPLPAAVVAFAGADSATDS